MKECEYCDGVQMPAFWHLMPFKMCPDCGAISGVFGLFMHTLLYLFREHTFQIVFHPGVPYHVAVASYLKGDTEDV